MCEFFVVLRSHVGTREVDVDVSIVQLNVQRVQKTADFATVQLPGLVDIGSSEQMPDPLVGDFSMRTNVRSVTADEKLDAFDPLRTDLFGFSEKIERVAVVVVENRKGQIDLIGGDFSLLDTLLPRVGRETLANLFDVADQTRPSVRFSTRATVVNGIFGQNEIVDARIAVPVGFEFNECSSTFQLIDEIDLLGLAAR